MPSPKSAGKASATYREVEVGSAQIFLRRDHGDVSCRLLALQPGLAAEVAEIWIQTRVRLKAKRLVRAAGLFRPDLLVATMAVSNLRRRSDGDEGEDSSLEVSHDTWSLTSRCSAQNRAAAIVRYNSALRIASTKAHRDEAARRRRR
jgi:hypothetical protein